MIELLLVEPAQQGMLHFFTGSTVDVLVILQRDDSEAPAGTSLHVTRYCRDMIQRTVLEMRVQRCAWLTRR